MTKEPDRKTLLGSRWVSKLTWTEKKVIESGVQSTQRKLKIAEDRFVQLNDNSDQY